MLKFCASGPPVAYWSPLRSCPSRSGWGDSGRRSGRWSSYPRHWQRSSGRWSFPRTAARRREAEPSAPHPPHNTHSGLQWLAPHTSWWMCKWKKIIKNLKIWSKKEKLSSNALHHQNTGILLRHTNFDTFLLQLAFWMCFVLLSLP